MILDSRLVICHPSRKSSPPPSSASKAKQAKPDPDRPKPVFSANLLEKLDGCGDVEELRAANETTPDKFTAPTAPYSAANPPGAPKRKSKPAPRPAERPPRAKKRLDFDSPPNFKLQGLYEHIFGRESESAHGAEADCMTLMRVCAAKSPGFLQCVREKHERGEVKTLGEVAKMW